MPTLEEVMKKVNTDFKQKIANKGVVFEKIKRVPFSSPRLNYMTYGGLPLGRIVEFAGDEGGGKTTSALDIIKNAQRMLPDKKCVLVDVERTFDEDWARLLGVDVENLILITPNEQTAEEIFEIIKALVETGEVSVVVLDSLGVMISKQAYEKTMEEKTYGGIAAALTLFSKKMIPILARENTLLIGINQMREDMNSQYGGTTTTGGRGWRHDCSMRLQFMKSDYIDEKGVSLSRGCENPAGNLVRVSMIKSKVCKMDRKVGFYTLRYLSGIDYVLDIIDVGVKEGLVNKAGSWFSLVDYETGEVFKIDGKDAKFQGKNELREFLIANNDWLEDLNEQLLLKLA